MADIAAAFGVMQPGDFMAAQARGFDFVDDFAAGDFVAGDFMHDTAGHFVNSVFCGCRGVPDGVVGFGVSCSGEAHGHENHAGDCA
jgi:2-keto-3-deoxy-6-phosphogluconate aldolase